MSLYLYGYIYIYIYRSATADRARPVYHNVYMHECAPRSMHIHAYVCTCIHMPRLQIHVHACGCICVHMHARTIDEYVYVCVCVYMSWGKQKKRNNLLFDKEIYIPRHGYSPIPTPPSTCPTLQSASCQNLHDRDSSPRRQNRSDISQPCRDMPHVRAR